MLTDYFLSGSPRNDVDVFIVLKKIKGLAVTSVTEKFDPGIIDLGIIDPLVRRFVYAWPDPLLTVS